MPGRGGKGGKRAKNQGDVRKRELPFKGDGQEYARATNMLGSGRLALVCADGVGRLGIIRGNMRKREWVNAGDLVLVGLRSFQDGKADVVFRYTPTEALLLAQYGELSGLPNADVAEEDDNLVFEVDELDLAAI